MTGIILSILLLSLAIFSGAEGTSIALAQQQPAIPPLPQPNAPQVLIANSSGHAWYLPDLGLANFYGQADPTQHILRGVLAQPGLFPCVGDPVPKCNVSVPGTFNGTFEQANKDNVTSVTATFKAPSFVTPVGVQIKDHVYKITTTNFNWNRTDSELQTPQPGFAKIASNVARNQMQHGLSRIDRSDVHQIDENPGEFSYGYADVTDMNTSKKVASVFLHTMVGQLVNESNYYKYMRNDPISPRLAIVIAASIPANVQLPAGDWRPFCSSSMMCTAAEADGFFPLSTDEALKMPPPFAYPVAYPFPRNGTAPIVAPGPSSEQPVSIKGQPFFFATVVYPGADIHLYPLKKTSGGK